MEKVPLLCSYRLLLAFVSCLCLINLYALRINMSVAIVCMINHTHLETQEMQGDLLENNSQNIINSIEMSKCVNTLSNNTKQSNGPYTWSKEMQGNILAAFFWGYLVTQVAGGVIGDRWGGKYVIGWSMFVNIVASFLLPISSSVSPYLVIALRAVQGLGQGMVLPALQSLWAKWAPPQERTKLLGLTFAGGPLGSVIVFPVSGLLCDLGFAGGWPSIFYVFGIFGFAWFILWMAMVASSPSEHRYISEAERRYIETSIGSPPSSHSTPWLKMMTSPAVWALIVAYMCTEWGTVAMHTYGPTYMNDVLKFDIKQNGLLSAIPYMVFWMFIGIASYVSDAFLVRGWKTTTVRKLSLCSGSLLPAAFLVMTGYITCEMPYVAFSLLTLGIGFRGLQFSGHMLNHMDIAPSYSGSLMGIANSFATLTSISAPYLVAILTPKGTQGEWQIVFYVAAAIYTFGAVVYVIAASGEVQSWAMPDKGGKSIDLSVTDSVEPIYSDNWVMCRRTRL